MQKISCFNGRSQLYRCRFFFKSAQFMHGSRTVCRSILSHPVQWRCAQAKGAQKFDMSVFVLALFARYCILALMFALLLHRQFLGYGTALDGKQPTRAHVLFEFSFCFSVGIIQNIRRGVVEGIAKRWLQDSNCCTPYRTLLSVQQILVSLSLTIF